jgi:hypothetical protein
VQLKAFRLNQPDVQLVIDQIDSRPNKAWTVALPGYYENDFKSIKIKTFEWIISKIHSKLEGYTHCPTDS